MTDPLIANLELDPDLQRTLEAIIDAARKGDWQMHDPSVWSALATVQQQRRELAELRGERTGYAAAADRLVIKLAERDALLDALDRHLRVWWQTTQPDAYPGAAAALGGLIGAYRSIAGELRRINEA